MHSITHPFSIIFGGFWGSSGNKLVSMKGKDDSTVFQEGSEKKRVQNWVAELYLSRRENITEGTCLNFQTWTNLVASLPLTGQQTVYMLCSTFLSIIQHFRGL